MMRGRARVAPPQLPLEIVDVVAAHRDDLGATGARQFGRFAHRLVRSVVDEDGALAAGEQGQHAEVQQA